MGVHLSRCAPLLTVVSTSNNDQPQDRMPSRNLTRLLLNSFTAFQTLYASWAPGIPPCDDFLAVHSHLDRMYEEKIEDSQAGTVLVEREYLGSTGGKSDERGLKHTGTSLTLAF